MPKVTYSLNSLNRILKKEEPSKICLVTSLTLVNKLSWAIKVIKRPGIKIALILDGERAKEWSEIKKLLQKFITLNLDRKSVVIALGGGTVGDAAGFASAIYLRGIRYIQIPTTLLAQVDSAHGGKTGINFSKFKNQIGSFHEPLATIIDTRFLNSLSKEQIIDGLGEIIKEGIIKDPKILSLLKNEKVSTIGKSPKLPRIIKRAIKVKQFFINKDFKDHDVRQILNVGHTFGHAIELKYKLSHGRAVIAGLLQELKWTESLKFTAPSVRKNLVKLLRQLGIKIDKNLPVDWPTIIHDKKITGDKIMLPVVRKEGRADLIMLKISILKQAIRQN